MELSDLRRDFGSHPFHPERTPANPAILLEQWLSDAADHMITDFNAMMLSTVNQLGRPSSRIVLLKGLREEGLLFYTHYKSRKGMDLSLNPNASVLFFWKELERQVRIEGKVQQISRRESEDYFNSRPLESRASAMVSPQSQPITSLEALRQQRDEAMQNPSQVVCPDDWGGYSLKPDYYEFWQGGAHRLHHRLVYEFDGSGNKWTKLLLAP